MRLKINKSLYPLFFFVGSSLSIGTAFGLHTLLNRPDVLISKKNRMLEYPRNLK